MPRRVPRPLVAALLIALSLPVPPAFSCGGPESYNLAAPLMPVESLLRNVLAPTDDLDDVFPIPEMSFVYPFHLARPEEVEALWRMVDGPGDAWSRYLFFTKKGPLDLGLGTPDAGALQGAIERGDFAAAGREARAIVDRTLDLPAPAADGSQDALRRAVEFLELQPSLASVDRATAIRLLTGGLDGADDAGLPEVVREALVVRRMKRSEAESLAAQHPSSPRIASLRFVAMRERMHTDLPNGWKLEIQEGMTPEGWRRLETMHDEWLRDYPQHPLADLVRLSKERLHYLQGWYDDAWETLLAVYPRRLPRVLYEMRYLLGMGKFPPNLRDPRIDPLLLSALLSRVPQQMMASDTRLSLDAADWSACWKIAEAGGKAPWAINMQERLLARVATIVAPGRPLPAGFPDKPANPTQLWGKMRMYALLQAGLPDSARQQAWSLKPDPDIALVRARLLLVVHKYAEAAQVEQLDEHVRRYLIRVILDDGALASLSAATDPAIRQEALLARAVRDAGKDDWQGGANLLKSADPAKAALWAQAARLRADRTPRGRLAFARFLRDRNGQLFYPIDRPWARSIGWRLGVLTRDPSTLAPPPALPWSVEFETGAIRAQLRASSEMYRAFVEYAAWLAGPGRGDPQARDVLKEADAAYNWLSIYPDTDAHWSPWSSYLQTCDAALTVRRIGKELRQ